MTVIRGSLLLAASAILLAACAAPRPATTDDGLQRLSSRAVDELWLRPGATLAGYDRLLLDAVDISFDRNWDPRSFGPWGLDADEVARIRSDLAALARQVFARRLEYTGYALADAAGPGVLRVKLRLTDVYVNAPEPPEPGRRVLVFEFGHMTLQAEAGDALSGLALLRVVDRMQRRDEQHLEWAAGTFNRLEAEREFTRWADALAAALGAAQLRRTNP